MYPPNRLICKEGRFTNVIAAQGILYRHFDRVLVHATNLACTPTTPHPAGQRGQIAKLKAELKDRDHAFAAARGGLQRPNKQL